MKKLIVILFFIVCGVKGYSQFRFPSTDSLHRYTNRFVTNSAINSFTDYRMNTLIHGIINWIDSARLGIGGSIGVDTIYALNDSTIRYKKNGVVYTFNLRGRYWTLQQVLNNGSTLTENKTITLADSITFASGKVLIENLRLTNLVQQSDTTLYKPIAQDVNGNLFKFDHWPGSGGAGTASNGIRLNSGNFELGDVAGQSLTTLSTNRFLRSGNNSIYFQGNKTNEGNANIIFDDTLTATAGNPRFKTWMQINSLDHIPAPYLLGTSSVDDGTTGFNNHVMNFGFNLKPNGSRSNLTYGAFGISWEGNFQGLQEMHYFWIPKDNIQRRISSYTLDTAAKTVDWYGQISSWSLKNISSGAEPWVQFSGGNGGTNTSFHVYSGSTNQYNLQYGFGVGGGNTTASISTNGPGDREFYLNNAQGGWANVYLPSFTSRLTYNEFSQQVLPTVDGTIRLGSQTQKWLKVDNYYTRSNFGILIGDYSSDNDPGTALEITRPGNANGHIHITGTDNAGNGMIVEGSGGGNTFIQLKAQTGAGAVPLLTLVDHDNTGNSAALVLERSTSAVMAGTQNDLLIYNNTSGKNILFGTNSGSGRTRRVVIDSAGRFGVGPSAPTAFVHIRAGTATANTAPLKLTGGTNLTTPEDGAIEYDGADYFATVSSTRYNLVRSLSGSTTHDFGTLGNNSSATTNITVTGATDGDFVLVTKPAASGWSNGEVYAGWVSSSNTVTVRQSNHSGGSAGFGSQTINVKVIKQ